MQGEQARGAVTMGGAGGAEGEDRAAAPYKGKQNSKQGRGGEEEKGADRASPSTGKAGGIGRDSRAGQCREED